MLGTVILDFEELGMRGKECRRRLVVAQPAAVTKMVAGMRFSISVERMRSSVLPMQASKVSATRGALCGAGCDLQMQARLHQTVLTGLSRGRHQRAAGQHQRQRSTKTEGRARQRHGRETLKRETAR